MWRGLVVGGLIGLVWVGFKAYTQEVLVAGLLARTLGGVVGGAVSGALIGIAIEKGWFRFRSQS